MPCAGAPGSLHCCGPRLPAAERLLRIFLLSITKRFFTDYSLPLRLTKSENDNSNNNHINDNSNNNNKNNNNDNDKNDNKIV